MGIMKHGHLKSEIEVLFDKWSNWFKAGPAFTLDVLQYLLSAILPFYIILFLFYHTFIK
jgi:hypothetical protein